MSDFKSQSKIQGAAAADTPQTLPSVTTELPPEALALLAPEEEVHLSISTDIKLDGLYGPAWLLATEKRLLAFSPNGGGPPEIVDLPLAEIESRAVALEPFAAGVEALARALREKGVVGRIAKERLLLDMRTVDEEEIEWVASALDEVVR